MYIVNPRYKMSMYIILDFGYSISFSHKTIFKLIFLNNEKTYGDGTIMVYTRLHVLLIDINKIEIGSDSNFGGKVLSSFSKNLETEKEYYQV